MNEKIEKQLDKEKLTLATITKRGFAFFLDEFIISSLFYIIFANRLSSAESMEILIALINMLFLQVILLKIIYHTFFVWMYGATPGKMLLKIKIVSIEDFEKPNMINSFIRSTVRIVSEMIFYLGFLWAIFDSVNQTWHDKAAKTVVVNV